jgi:L-ascorbate metabolism protein UlaG (beta-lactamase superfamily)
LKIKWMGLASFLITSESGVKIINDPYEPGADPYGHGHELHYGRITDSADIVTVSHDHWDHNKVKAVKGNPKVFREPGETEVKGIKINGVASFHDDVGGKERGPKSIFCLEVDGIKVCHLGDLGHKLSKEQLEEIGPVDVLLAPVGGVFTIDAKTATELAGLLKAKIIIPMHYKHDKCNFPVAEVDDFLVDKEKVSQPGASEIELHKGDLPKSATVVVLNAAC